MSLKIYLETLNQMGTAEFEKLRALESLDSLVYIDFFSIYRGEYAKNILDAGFFTPDKVSEGREFLEDQLKSLQFGVGISAALEMKRYEALRDLISVFSWEEPWAN